MAAEQPVKRSLLTELKRRNVLRSAVLYVGAVWALAQGISQLTPAIGLPDGATRWFLIAASIGFPFWIAFAWFYEFTPQGIKRDSEVADDASTRHSNARRLDFAIFGVMALAIVLLASGYFVRRTMPSASGSTNGIPAKSIAVLPFENLSNDKNNEYFVAGMQDLILTKLADIGSLKVISRTSTEKYQSRPANLKQVAAELGVATILEGSVQKQGDQVLINVQLIEASADSHIWAQSYQRTLDNIFGVEGEVAQQIADALQAKLSPAKTEQLAAVPTTNQAAYDAFLRAEYLAKRSFVDYTAAGFEAAIPLYRQAIARDPAFALAYARLSFAESGAVWFGSGENDGKQLAADARANAEKALALQPDLVEGNVALGYAAYWGRQDYATALKAFAAALKLRPNDSDALAGTGYVLRRQGRFDAAIDAMEKALALDPRNASLADNLGETYAAVNRNVDAERLYQRALAIDPGSFQASNDYSQLVASSGDVARALQVAQGDAPVLKWQRSQLLTLRRKYPEALALLGEVPDTADNFPYQIGPKALGLADLHRLMGDTAHAQPLYAQALAQSRSRLATLAGDAMKQGFVWNHIAAAELGLGQTDDALAAITRSQVSAEQSGDHFFAPWVTSMNAALYAQARRADLALPLIAQMLANPTIGYTMSPALLWLDPVWDPIRNEPGFQALLQQYAKYKPAVIPAAPASSVNVPPAS